MGVEYDHELCARLPCRRGMKQTTEELWLTTCELVLTAGDTDVGHWLDDSDGYSYVTMNNRRQNGFPSDGFLEFGQNCMSDVIWGFRVHSSPIVSWRTGGDGLACHDQTL